MNRMTDYKNIYYPPGGILIWIIIFVEMLTFMVSLVAFTIQGRYQAETFLLSQQMLNQYYGVINTLVLITGGYFMARAITEMKKNQELLKANKWIMYAIFAGIIFLLIKSWEYYEKLKAGIGIDYNDFFTYYWLLTMFHYLHVLVALTILSFIFFKIKKRQILIANLADIEAGAAFWHMCDLIWLFLFPILYLLH